MDERLVAVEDAVPARQQIALKPALAEVLRENLDDTPFEPKYVQPEMVVFDTVYNPEQTYLLKIAREAGCRVITG